MKKKKKTPLEMSLSEQYWDQERKNPQLSEKQNKRYISVTLQTIKLETEFPVAC